MMTRAHCLFGTILLLTTTFDSLHSADTNPGFKVTITNKGLEFGEFQNMTNINLASGIWRHQTEYYRYSWHFMHLQ